MKSKFQTICHERKHDIYKTTKKRLIKYVEEGK
jgi:hypothetical protein